MAFMSPSSSDRRMAATLEASLAWLAVGSFFVAASLAPSGAAAQSTAIKRAAPPAKSHSKSAVRTPSSWIPNPAVGGKDAYLILDATSGRELVADRADELRHPASLTKLMTIYLTFSALDSGRLSLGDVARTRLGWFMALFFGLQRRVSSVVEKP